MPQTVLQRNSEDHEIFAVSGELLRCDGRILLRITVEPNPKYRPDEPENARHEERLSPSERTDQPRNEGN